MGNHLSKVPVSFISELLLSHGQEVFAVHEETRATANNSCNNNQGVEPQIDLYGLPWEQLL